jgi:hypothetical protein
MGILCWASLLIRPKHFKKQTMGNVTTDCQRQNMSKKRRTGDKPAKNVEVETIRNEPRLSHNYRFCFYPERG